MSYNVKILADSFAPCGKRLTTFECSYPRFVHAELMTHRLFSRNSASSRAIPSAKLIDRVMNDPAMPKWWGKNVAGMQAPEELVDVGQPTDGRPVQPYIAAFPRTAAQEVWLEARNAAVQYAEKLAAIGLHKQIANRLVEPWMFITVLVSATEYENFFRLRCHPAAQPEIRWVAEEMKQLYDAAEPVKLAPGEWHLPLWQVDEWKEISYETAVAKKIAVARCARVSYLTHDGKRDFAEDLRLHDRLAESGHWSPFEHVAMALDEPKRIGNFVGFRQYRADVDPHYLAIG